AAPRGAPGAPPGPPPPSRAVPPVGLLAPLVGKRQELEPPLPDAPLDRGAAWRQQSPVGRVVPVRNHAVEEGGPAPHRTMSGRRSLLEQALDFPRRLEPGIHMLANL